MFPDRSYKFAFIGAVLVHVIILVFLFIKFTSSSNLYTMENSENVIQATVVEQKTVHETHVQPQAVLKPKPVIPLPLVPKKAAAPSTPQPDPVLLRQQQQKLKKQELKAVQDELAHEAEKMRAEQQQVVLQKELEQELRAEKDSLAAAQKDNAAKQATVHATQGEVDKYKAAVLQAISSNWIVPDGVAKGATCLLLVSVAPGGVVLEVKLLQSSGNTVLDRSAQTAVLKSSPLPVPTDPILFDSFRTIKLIVRPEGIGSEG